MIKIDIYRSFEQWKNGNVLEHGVPRTEYYSEAQLDLVEMGWNYGYDAGLAEPPAQPLKNYINAASINGDDCPHVVVEKLQRAIDAANGITKGNT